MALHILEGAKLAEYTLSQPGILYITCIQSILISVPRILLRWTAQFSSLLPSLQRAYLTALPRSSKCCGQSGSVGTQSRRRVNHSQPFRRGTKFDFRREELRLATYHSAGTLRSSGARRQALNDPDEVRETSVKRVHLSVSRTVKSVLARLRRR